jgi:hypothetical protein
MKILKIGDIYIELSSTTFELLEASADTTQITLRPNADMYTSQEYWVQGELKDVRKQIEKFIKKRNLTLLELCAASQPT